MTRSAKLVWLAGNLIPTFLAGAVAAWVRELELVSALLLAVCVLTVARNAAILNTIRAAMSTELRIVRSEKMPLAGSAESLLVVLVPVTDLFSDGIAWAVVLLTLVLVLGVMQLARATPPPLLLVAFGYLPHKAEVSSGSFQLWLNGKSQLSPGDVVVGVETEQKVWIGRISDVGGH